MPFTSQNYFNFISLKKLHLRILASIFFLSVLLFNWFGYQLLMDYMQQKQSAGFELKLDNNQYDENNLIEVRIPLSLPYQNDWANYERVDGEIEYNGTHYKFVKRKIENGVLILKCIPNEEKVLMVNARENFFKLVNDLQAKSSSNQSSKNQQHTAKSFNFDYCEKTIAWIFNQPEIKLNNGSSYTEQSLLSVLILTPEQPPEA